MGARGRLVVPAEVRQRVGREEGIALRLLTTPDGIALMTRRNSEPRQELDGLDLAGELLADRRRAAADAGARSSWTVSRCSSARTNPGQLNGVETGPV